MSLTKEEERQLEEFYAAGDPFERLADAYGCPDPYGTGQEPPSVAEMLSIGECNMRKGDG